uniref:uncharacterized protein n=1 Tax=Myxine glutinosa TaxID=7769 RepID=UPI00358E2C1D
MNRAVKVELRGTTVYVLRTGKPWHACHSCCLAGGAPLLMCLLLMLGSPGSTGREQDTCGFCGPQQGLQCSISDNDCDRPLPFIKVPPGTATDLHVEITASEGKLWLQVHWSLPMDASVHAITHILLEVLYSDLELHCVLFTLAHPLPSQRAPDGGKWRFSYDCISVEPQDLVVINVYTVPLGTPPLSTHFQVQDCHEETMTRLAPQHCQGPHLSVISHVAEDGEVLIDYNSSFLSERHAAFPCLFRGSACLTQRSVPHDLVMATGSSGQFHLRGLPALPCLCVQVFPVDVSHRRAQVCPFFRKRWMQVEGNVQVLPGIITVQIRVLPQQCLMRLWLCLWVLEHGEAGRPVSGTQKEALIGNWTLEYSLNEALVQEAAQNTLCVKVWSDGRFLMEDKVFCPPGECELIKVWRVSSPTKLYAD